MGSLVFPYMLHLPLILFLSIYFKKKYTHSTLAAFYTPSLLVKLAAGIAVGLLYTFYYTYGGDTMFYQDYSATLTRILFTDPQKYFRILLFSDFSTASPAADLSAQPRALLFAKILSLLNVFTFSSYWINALYFSFFAFTGLWCLGNRVITYYGVSGRVIFFSFFLYPSFVIWSAGILKESVTTGCICFLLCFYLDILFRKKISMLKVFLMTSLLFLGAMIKYYYFLLLVPCMISYAFVFGMKKKKPDLSLGVTYLLFTLLVLFLLLLPVMFYPPILNYILTVMHYSYTTILQASDPANTFVFPGLRPDLLSYLLHFPQAAFTGLLRPFPGETQSGPAWIAGIENLVLALLLLAQIFKRIREKKYSLPLHMFAILTYAILTAGFMAYIAPNWGTLDRYKTGFIFLWILLIANKNPLIEKSGEANKATAR